MQQKVLEKKISIKNAVRYHYQIGKTQARMSKGNQETGKNKTIKAKSTVFNTRWKHFSFTKVTFRNS